MPQGLTLCAWRFHQRQALLQEALLRNEAMEATSVPPPQHLLQT